MQAISKFREMMTEMEMKYPNTSDKERDLNILTHSVNPVRLKNNPILLETEVISRLYNSLLIIS